MSEVFVSYLQFIKFAENKKSMISFPPAKINIGLYIGRTLSNGYHLIETVMVATGFCDILEIIPSDTPGCRLNLSGVSIGGEPENNLVVKAYNLFTNRFPARYAGVDIYLHKNIPDGAGLGGGSSDASYTLRMLNTINDEPADDETLEKMASELGADCPFFIKAKTSVSRGIGCDLSPVELDIKGLGIVMLKGNTAKVSTRDAYNTAKCRDTLPDLPHQLLSNEISEWKWLVSNDFESGMAGETAQVSYFKKLLYDNGALFASMSGSGAVVYGLFANQDIAENAAWKINENIVYIGSL